jgi:DNA-binding CsgD family transcriptional regulator
MNATEIRPPIIRRQAQNTTSSFAPRTPAVTQGPLLREEETPTAPNVPNPPNLPAETSSAEQTLTSQECKELLGLVGRLYLQDDLSQLPRQVLRSLAALIPHDLGGLHLIHPLQQHWVAFYEPNPRLPQVPEPDKDQKDSWNSWNCHLWAEDPLRTLLFSHAGQAWKLSEVVSQRAFHNTAPYRTFYGPLGLEYGLGAAVPEPAKPGEFLFICLQRAREDFSERERTILNLLLPHIVEARHRLCVVAAHRVGMVPREPLQFREWLSNRTRWELTPRESEVLFWLCQGKTNSEIGRILGIAERTAETHALRIYPKMGVENRYTAIATMTRLSVGQEE